MEYGPDLPEIYLENLTRRYSDVIAVDHMSLRVLDGEILTLLGPSGCGKTTLLRCVAGFLKPDEGEIYLDGKTITDLPPEKRGMGMVFQSYALWPHMTVFDNIAFGLKLRKTPEEEINKQVREVLDMVRLSGLELRFPRQLSGGQQQRVAVARALAMKPKVLLFDEPLSNLDAKLREEMRFEVKDLQRRLKITSVYVTHDQAEALVLSDRIALMDKGRLVYLGTPREIYDYPKNKFVADFIGVTSFIDGVVETFNSNENRAIITTKDGFSIHAFARDVKKGQSVIVSIRPEHIRLSALRKSEGPNKFEGTISKLAYLGNSINYHIQVGEWPLRTQTGPESVFKPNEKVEVYLDPEKITVITG